jgi:tRNA pseudouridine38-40 synthase
VTFRTASEPGLPSAGSRARLRLDVAYDGTEFSGWAAQPDRRTVAGVLGDVLGRILPGADGLTVAGRTDAGVHATGQVCHVDVPVPAWERVSETLVRRLAGLLPPDVRVRAATEVPPSFDARFSATYRRYEYRVCDDPVGAPPLRRYDTLSWPRPLDPAAMSEAAKGLLGEHDFASYCKRKENATTIRAIDQLEWRRDEAGILIATVRADAFCQAMVRSLVGALLAVGDGRRPPEWPASLLTRRERANDVMVVAPHGLTLVEVGYPDDPAEWERRARLTRRMREP